MKKIFTFIGLILCTGLFVSCSNSKKTTVDASSSTERLGLTWLDQDGAVKYRSPMNESAEGAHFTLALPENPDEMIRTHFVAIEKKQIKENKVNILYASQRYSTLQSLTTSISQVVEDNAETINSSITAYEANVQTAWSQSVEIEAKDNQGVFIYYLPLKLNYYSGTDELTTGILYTYVLVPINVIVTSYTKTDDVYTFDNATATKDKDILISWTSDKYGSIA